MIAIRIQCDLVVKEITVNVVEELENTLRLIIDYWILLI